MLKLSFNTLTTRLKLTHSDFHIKQKVYYINTTQNPYL